MNDKFKGVPKDPDTRIRKQSVTIIEGFDALHQHWTWDGIKAESAIFVTSEVEHLDEEQLKSLLVASGLTNTTDKMTFKKSTSGYTFLNFNFVT